MAVDRSRRQYLSIDELEEYADISVDDSEEAYDQIRQAEEMIDSFVGNIEKHISRVHEGIATGGTVNTVIDTSDDSPLDDKDDDYWTFCEIEFLSGDNKGERTLIISSDESASEVTLMENMDSVVASGDAYRVYQLGKFPRNEEVYHETSDDEKYFKWIPEAVKRATAAQVEYMIRMGDRFFSTSTPHKTQERVGKGDWEANFNQRVSLLIAPKAQRILMGAGLVNRTGKITSGHPSFT